MTDQAQQTAEPQQPKLTAKQRKFIDAYMGEAKGVGVDAARLAEYKGNDATLAQVAYENLRKPEIQAEIARRTAMIISEVELIHRYARQSRGSLGLFLEVTEEEIILSETKVGEGDQEKVVTMSVKRPVARLNLMSPQAQANLDLIKKYRIAKDGSESIELYDAQAAQRALGEMHGMFRQGPAGTEDDPLHSVQHSVDEWKQLRERQRQQAAETMRAFAGNEEGGEE